MDNKIEQLNYDLLKKEAIQFLDKNKIMVLATSANNRVTARPMSCVNIDLDIYFQTDDRFLKFQQIKENPNVAFSASNLQIEGVATIGKHPFDHSNKEFLGLFQKFHSGSFKIYSHLKHNLVIKISPTLITLWKYENKQPYRDLLYVAEQKAERRYYDISN